MADKGISFPFRIIGGKVITSTYDENSVVKIQESIAQILMTSKREWLERNVGSAGDGMLFKSQGELLGYLGSQLEQDIKEQEPRVQNPSVTLAQQAEGLVQIQVTFSVRDNPVNMNLQVRI